MLRIPFLLILFTCMVVKVQAYHSSCTSCRTIAEEDLINVTFTVTNASTDSLVSGSWPWVVSQIKAMQTNTSECGKRAVVNFNISSTTYEIYIPAKINTGLSEVVFDMPIIIDGRTQPGYIPALGPRIVIATEEYQIQCSHSAVYAIRFDKGKRDQRSILYFHSGTTPAQTINSLIVDGCVFTNSSYGLGFNKCQYFEVTNTNTNYIPGQGYTPGGIGIAASFCLDGKIGKPGEENFISGDYPVVLHVPESDRVSFQDNTARHASHLLTRIIYGPGFTYDSQPQTWANRQLLLNNPTTGTVTGYCSLTSPTANQIFLCAMSKMNNSLLWPVITYVSPPGPGGEVSGVATQHSYWSTNSIPLKVRVFSGIQTQSVLEYVGDADVDLVDGSWELLDVNVDATKYYYAVCYEDPSSVTYPRTSIASPPSYCLKPEIVYEYDECSGIYLLKTVANIPEGYTYTIKWYKTSNLSQPVRTASTYTPTTNDEYVASLSINSIYMPAACEHFSDPITITIQQPPATTGIID